MTDDGGVPVAVWKRLQLSLVGFRWDPAGYWYWGGVRLSDETVDHLAPERWEALVTLASGGTVVVWN